MLITDKQFKSLTNAHGGLCVTIYIPTQRDSDGRQEQQHFDKLLKEAVAQLQEKGKTKEEALKFLHRAYELLDDKSFWTYLSDGLAVYISEKGFEHYILPIDFESFLYVGEKFYLRPILPVLSGEGRFFLLALGHDDIKLYEGTHHSLRPVQIENLIPFDFAKAMETAYAESDLSMYTGEGAASKPLQHSRGEEAPKEVRDIRGYFRQIDEGLSTVLEGLRVPLILAAPKRLVPVFLDITNYPDTVSFHVEGDPASMSAEALHTKAWSQLKDHHKTIKDNYRRQFSDMEDADKAGTDEEAIIKAAEKGDVSVLFTHKGEHIWGTYDEEASSVTIHSRKHTDSEDLMDRSAVQTYLNGGRVFNVDESNMPKSDAKLNAVFK